MEDVLLFFTCTCSSCLIFLIPCVGGASAQVAREHVANGAAVVGRGLRRGLVGAAAAVGRIAVVAGVAL